MERCDVVVEDHMNTVVCEHLVNDCAILYAAPTKSKRSRIQYSGTPCAGCPAFGGQERPTEDSSGLTDPRMDLF